MWLMTRRVFNRLADVFLRLGLGALLGGSAVSVAQAAEYAELWGPTIGSAIPLLEAPDQNGQVRNIKDLAGSRGLLLVFSRSADW